MSEHYSTVALHVFQQTRETTLLSVTVSVLSVISSFVLLFCLSVSLSFFFISSCSQTVFVSLLHSSLFCIGLFCHCVYMPLISVTFLLLFCHFMRSVSLSVCHSFRLSVILCCCQTVFVSFLLPVLNLSAFLYWSFLSLCLDATDFWNFPSVILSLYEICVTVCMSFFSSFCHIVLLSNCVCIFSSSRLKSFCLSVLVSSATLSICH